MAPSLLDFYQQHAISPVRQDITDLPAHFARRAHLYRSLGLPPMAVQGRDVLEIGPGGGENALYTMSLRPRDYTALEPNRVAAEAMRELFDAHGIKHRNRIFACGLNPDPESLPDSHHDLVLCEGLLGLCGSDPAKLLEQVIKYVRRGGGILVITCIDAISDHAEVLRRAQAQQMLTEHGLRNAPLADQVALLRPVFAPHLATLTGMTRSVDDWILDNLINPASIGPMFSIPEACAQLDGRFEVLGCSPRFLLDWRWYKDATPGNQWAIDSYWRQALSLYDYRSQTGVQSTESLNRALDARCQKTREALRAYEAGDGPAPSTDALRDPAWFGRGQQYLSFVRV